MNENAADSRRQWILEAYQAHQNRLERYALSLLGDLEAAREVVQETFVQLCRTEREKIDASLAAWLFTVCRNKAFDVRRKERLVLEKRSQAPEPSTEFREPAEIVEQSQSADVVLGLLARLPEKQQEVVRLKFQAGLSYAEIASTTGNSLSNVGYLIHTAIKTMRSRFAQLEADEVRGGAR